MKRLIISISLILLYVASFGKGEKTYDFVDAVELTVVGKLFYDTPSPFHRVDTCRFNKFNARENALVRQSSGISIAFRSNSPSVSFLPEYGIIDSKPHTTDMSTKGFDLYVKDKDGRFGPPDRWIYVESHSGRDGKASVIKENMDGSMKEFLLYLPTFSEILSLKIGVERGCVIEKIENPFRHRIGVFGSSFTHGASTTRSGMTYPAQFSRITGIQLLSLGVSGNCRMQEHFAEVLAAADVDAFIFDTFSNSSSGMIEERLFPFIEKIQAAHPDIPLIFQQTIYRETRNFDAPTDKREQKRMETAQAMMEKAMKKYKNVFFVIPNATSEYHDTSVDGIHPTDYGYYLWVESVREQILKILAEYGIR